MRRSQRPPPSGAQGSAGERLRIRSGVCADPRSLACVLHRATVSSQDLVYDLLSATKMIALHVPMELIYRSCVNDIISISARDEFLSFSVLH